MKVSVAHILNKNYFENNPRVLIISNYYDLWRFHSLIDLLIVYRLQEKYFLSINFNFSV
jgi:hypothetical protein